VNDVQAPALHGPAARDRDYERLADHFEAHVDVEAINNWIWEARTNCRQ
jgi:hypothetical protein